MAKLVSHVYGEALFGLAVESGRTEQFHEELAAVAQILNDYPDYAAILSHPQLDAEEKTQVFDRAFHGKVSDELIGFFHILLSKGRFSETAAIADYFEEKWLEKSGIGVAYVTSAVALDSRQQKKIESRLLETTGYQSMQMHYDTDPALIGGLTIRIGDRVVDSSIKSKLQDMKQELMKIQL